MLCGLSNKSSGKLSTEIHLQELRRPITYSASVKAVANLAVTGEKKIRPSDDKENGIPGSNQMYPTSGALGPPSMRPREAFAGGLGRLSSSAGSPLCNLGMSETSLPLARGDADAA